MMREEVTVSDRYWEDAKRELLSKGRFLRCASLRDAPVEMTVKPANYETL